MLVISVAVSLFLVIKDLVAKSTNIHPLIVVRMLNMGLVINVRLKLLRALSTLLAMEGTHSADVVAKAGHQVMRHSTLDTEVADLKGK